MTVAVALLALVALAALWEVTCLWRYVHRLLLELDRLSKDVEALAQALAGGPRPRRAHLAPAPDPELRP